MALAVLLGGMLYVWERDLNIWFSLEMKWW